MHLTSWVLIGDTVAMVVRGQVCPHLYGVVTWNETEKSWDCPVYVLIIDRPKGVCTLS